MFTPYVGTVYKFTFKSPFNMYDGIYTVLRIMTFDEVVEDNVNLLKLYVDASLTEEDFDNDINTIRNDKILKLSTVNDDGNIVYIPMFLSLYEPDPNVKQYASLALGVNLGVFDNIEELNIIKHVIESTIAKKYGIPDSAAIFSINDIWMTDTEYAAIEHERAKYSKQLINLYSENERLRRELDSANIKIAYYEEKIIAGSDHLLNNDTGGGG